MGRAQSSRCLRRGGGAAGRIGLTLLANQTAWSAAEAAARDAFGRLVALLAGRSGDLAGAQDALGDALVAALERWPVDGVPANPPAWLLTVARRRGIDRTRRFVRAACLQTELVRMQEEAQDEMGAERCFPDERLGLLLACAHPAIDVAARTPLMLQVVLGISAERMASAFLCSPAAMTKRLVRAKTKLSTAGVRFVMPGADVLAERLQPVLDAVYAAFTLARNDAGDGPLEHEAVWLGRLLAELVPGDPEAAGLLSLMLFVSARGHVTTGQRFRPLSQQDPDAWDGGRIAEAEHRLRVAGRLCRPGRFQLEAAIQAIHADGRRRGETQWPAVLLLYEGLVALSPTIGVHVARAAAMAHAGDLAGALAALDALDASRIATHQPYWATRAHVLAGMRRSTAAADAYLRAAGLSESTSVREWLLERRAALDEDDMAT